MTEARRGERAARWVYGGVWSVLVSLLRVPAEAPTLPVAPGEANDVFHPAPGFLRWLKIQFWIVLALVDLMLLAVWIGLLVEATVVGLALSPLFLALIVVPDVVAWVAIHVRYDTTWYVLGPRSLRLRRGVWIVEEVTITFENIQNVRVEAGPLQQLCGIADVVVETAGAGGGGPKKGPAVANRGVLEGVANADAIRDRIMAHVRRTTRAGLGDEREPAAPRGGFSPQHLAVLREIRAAVAEMRAMPGP